jgi:hypothetical protein
LLTCWSGEWLIAAPTARSENMGTRRRNFMVADGWSGSYYFM